MKENVVITIARQYGSGGCYIGQKLSEKLGIPLIDKELLEMASIESGISQSLFNLADEKVRRGFLDKLRGDTYENVKLPTEDNFQSDRNLFNYQAMILRRMVLNDSFIVIGRAASYILKDYPNVVNVNIQAPYEVCVESIINRKGVTEKKARKDVKNINKYRRDFHKYYTGEKWELIDEYDLILNSYRIGRDECVDVIIDYTERKFGKKLLIKKEES